MSSDILTVVKAVKEWAQAPIKVMLVVCCTCGLALFLPKCLEVSAGIEPLVSHYVGWIWLAFVVSTFWLLFSAAESLLVSPLLSKRAERAMDKKLLALPQDERSILSEFVRRGQTSIPFLEARHRSNNQAFKSLVDKGILGVGGFSLDQDWYTLTSEANASIRKPNIRASITGSKD